MTLSKLCSRRPIWRNVPARAGCVVAAIGCLALGGCSLPLPEAQADPTKTYVLSVPGAAASRTPPAENAPVLRLRPVEVASYLKARSLIVRHGENEIELREFARWGEPIEQGIARVLREELLASGAVAAVEGAGVRSTQAADVRSELTVRVLSCEGTSEGAVLFHALWEIRPSDAGQGVSARGEYRATELTWKSGSEGTLAAALSRAIAGLANQIAAELAKPR